MKNTIIMSLAILGVVSFTSASSAETQRISGINYTVPFHKSTPPKFTAMEPIERSVRISGVTYTVPFHTSKPAKFTKMEPIEKRVRIAGVWQVVP